MMKYEGRTLKGQILVIEEVWIKDCTLQDCVFFYGGGVFQVENCKLVGKNEWKFHGPALQTLSLLQTIGMVPKAGIPGTQLPPIPKNKMN